MNYTKENLEKNRIKFEIEVDEADWKAAIDEAYQKSKSKFQIGGFRKGKVPRKVIEAQYGAGVFFDDALDIILPKTYGQVLDENPDLFVVDSPEIGISAISDSTLKYTATVQLKPEVKLGAYTGLEFKKDKTRITKEDIKKEADKALEQAGAWETITDRPVQNGDKTIIDYSGSVDGVKFEGGTAENQPLEIGSGMFIPGFEDQVIGMNVNDTKDIKVTFPAEYPEKKLAGKEAVFVVTLHEISTKVLPAYDDEFVKDVSEFDTIEQYEENIKKELKASREEAAEAKLENDMLDKFAELAEVEIPDCMVNQEEEQMMQELEYRMQSQGMDPKFYYDAVGKSREEMLKMYAPKALDNVKKRLIVDALTKAITIEVSDEEIEKYVANMAKQAGKKVEDYKKIIDDQYKSYIVNDIKVTKLFDYLKKNNEIK